MTQPVTIENDALQMDVWPGLGGKISSLIDKADHFELLFAYPVEYPVEHSQYDLPYAKGWYAGWDECFPAVCPSRYVGHPYDGIAVRSSSTASGGFSRSHRKPADPRYGYASPRNPSWLTRSARRMPSAGT